MSSNLLAINWETRPTPLPPVGIAARGAVAQALAARLLALADEDLAQLDGVAGAGLLVVTGDGARLPWADGVVYLGRDAAAPSLLLPTVWQPDVPLTLLERALLRQEAAVAPLAVLLNPPLLVSLAAARPLARTALLNQIERG